MLASVGRWAELSSSFADLVMEVDGAVARHVVDKAGPVHDQVLTGPQTKTDGTHTEGSVSVRETKAKDSLDDACV